MPLPFRALVSERAATQRHRAGTARSMRDLLIAGVVVLLLVVSTLLLLVGIAPVPQLIALLLAITIGSRMGTPITVSLLALGLHLPAITAAVLVSTQPDRLLAGAAGAALHVGIGVAVARMRAPSARGDDRRPLS